MLLALERPEPLDAAVRPVQAKHHNAQHDGRTEQRKGRPSERRWRVRVDRGFGPGCAPDFGPDFDPNRDRFHFSLPCGLFFPLLRASVAPMSRGDFYSIFHETFSPGRVYRYVDAVHVH